MTTRRKITPVDGKSIPLADGNGNLAQEGKTLTLNSYWYRLEADGDVSFSEPEEGLTETAAPAGTSADGATTKDKSGKK